MSSAYSNQDIVLHFGEKPKDVEATNGEVHYTKNEGATNGEVHTKNEGGPEVKIKTDQKKKLGTLGLFRYADCTDKVILIFGTLFAMGLGACMPLNILVYGDVANALIQHTNYKNLLDKTNKTNETLQQIDKLSEFADVFDICKGYALWFSLIGIGALVTGYFAVAFWTLASERQIKRIRQKFFESVMRQEIGWFDTHESGELSTRFSEDMHIILEGLGDKVATMVQWMTTFALSVTIAFISGWKLALVSLIFCPVIIIVGVFMVRWLRNLSAKEAQSYASAGAVAEEVFMSIRTVMAFNGQAKECERYEVNLEKANNMGFKKGIAGGLGQSTFWFFIYVAFGVCFWYGIYLIRSDEEGFEPGETLTIFMGIMIGSMSLGQAFPTLEVIGSARGAAEKVFEIIEQKSSIDFLSKEGRKLEKVEGNIRFTNLHFTYPARPDVKVLKGLSLEVNKGQSVALVGSSGCGKSTGIQLLQRFYNPEEGEIYLDGVNTKDLNVNWLRKQIGVVSQEPVLFATTIADNIRYGKIDVTQADIEKAAQEANAHDFIKQLPEGYETLVGNRGAQLSGGQKQRIAIARALVRNPKILLLDEATSALDNESEGIVQKALEMAQEGRTTIIIAHRLSTIRNADVIYAIEDGVVKEKGTHDELMAQKGLYYQLVLLQTQQNDKSEQEILGLEKKYRSDNELNLLSLGTRPSGGFGLDKFHSINILTVNEILSSIEDPSEASMFDGWRALRFLEAYAEDLENEFLHANEDDIHEKDSPIKMCPRTFSTSSMRKNKYKIQQSVVSTDDKKNKDKEEEEAEEIPNVPMKKILKMNSPEWYLIVIGIIVSVLMGAIPLTFPILLSEFIKVFTLDDEKAESVSLMLVGYSMGIACASAVFKMIIHMTFCIAGGNLTTRIRRLAFKSIVWQDMEFFDDPKNTVGALTTRLSTDSTLVQGATGQKIGSTLEALATILGALFIAFFFSWKLTLVVLGFMPLMMIRAIVQRKILTGFAKEDKASLDGAGQVFSEVVDNIRTVVSLTRESTFIDIYNGHVDNVYISARKWSFINGFLYGFSNSIMFFAYAGSFTYGSYLVQEGELEFHNVFRVFGAIIFGGMQAGKTLSFSMDFKKGQMAAARLFNIIERKPHIDAQEEKGDKPDTFEGNIELKGLKFRYPARRDVQVLKGLTITAKYGETVALVGTSGCGKSTTVQLLERFYDPEEGEVMVDGKNVKTMNINWLRSKMGFVSQEPVLFDNTIAENIAYGDTSRDVPMHEVIAAARMANIHNFIDELPHGYDTNVGDKGTQLSGGQKQRVAIARALVRNPKILLLDEATSALDTESERIVQEALDKAQQGRTCLVIAHRLSTIKNSNKIAIIHKGEVVELGSHSELMAFKGIYYKLSTHNQGK